MSLGLLAQPLWIVAALALPLLLLVTPYRTGWLFTLVVYAWADSSMIGGDEARPARVRVALLGALLLQGVVRLRGRGRTQPIPLPLGLLVGLALASILWSENRLTTTANVGWLVALAVAAFAHVARLGTSPRAVSTTAQAAVTVMLALILLGFVPRLRVDEWALAGRLRGFFNNPNGLGIVCALCAPWVVLRAAAARGAARVAWAGALGAMAMLAFFSGSRTGLGGLLAGVATTLFLRKPSRVLVACLVLGVVTSLASLAGTDIDLESGAIGGLTRTETLSRLAGRLDRWTAGLGLFQEAPVLGHGYKAVTELEAADPREAVATEPLLTGFNFHSQHIETMVGLGGIGEVVLLAALWSLLRRARDLALRRDEPELSWPGAAFAGTFVAAVLDSFFHNWVLSPGSPYAFLLWSFAALCCRLSTLAAAPAKAPAPRAARELLPTPVPA